MTRRRHIGTHDVVAVCCDIHDERADAVLDLLVRLDTAEGLRDGTRIRFGWSLLTLLGRGQTLELCEPDFARDPLSQVVRGIDVTLDVVAQQAEVARRTGAEAVDARFDEWLVASNTIGDAAELYLVRSPPRQSDTGWAITDALHPADDSGTNLTGLQVWQVLGIRPDVMAALGLPPNYTVVVRPEGIVAVFDPTGADRWTS